MKEMENNSLIHKYQITDFTGWGYGVLSYYKFHKRKNRYDHPQGDYSSNKGEFFIPVRGLCGWGDTAIDAYLKAIKTENSNPDYYPTEMKKNRTYSIKSFVFYRVSPRAKTYLDACGYFDNNGGFTDIAIIRVPYTIDENGYPVRYIIDLLDDDIIEKIDEKILPLWRIITNKNNKDKKEYFENHIKKYGTLITHDIAPLEHNLPKINITSDNNNPHNNDIKYDNSYHYGAILPCDRIVYGLGSTPAEAFMDGWNNSNGNIQKRYFEKFFKIVPLSKAAKMYIKSFGACKYPDDDDNDNSYSPYYKYTFGTKYYRFGERLLRIPPVLLDNGYPADLVIDIKGTKEIAMLKTLKKIIE